MYNPEPKAAACVTEANAISRLYAKYKPVVIARYNTTRAIKVKLYVGCLHLLDSRFSRVFIYLYTYITNLIVSWLNRFNVYGTCVFITKLNYCTTAAGVHRNITEKFYWYKIFIIKLKYISCKKCCCLLYLYFWFTK